jgi:hypothetical protein
LLDYPPISNFVGAFHMNEKQRAKWERTRAKGMWHFVLLCGGVFWGGMALMAAFIYRWDQLPIVLSIYLVAGLVFGLVTWFVGEYRYRKGSSKASAS